MNNKTNLLVPLCIFFSATATLAQKPPPDSRLSIFEQQKQAKLKREMRMKKGWTGNEQTFLQIERTLNEELNADKNAQSVSVKYKAEALKKPANSQAHFRWAYAALQAAPLIPESVDPSRGLRGVAEALWNAPSPKSYHYDRLLFLVETFDQSSPELRPLGERLVKRNPRDFSVIYKFIPMLKIGQIPQETQRALAYSQQLLKAEPQNPRYLSRLGYVHYRNMLFTKRRSDSDKALTAYRSYLAIAPANDAGRETAERRIRIMNRYRHTYKS